MAGFLCLQFLGATGCIAAQNPPAAAQHEFYLDCSAAANGDGSLSHPWNSLAAAEAQPFTAGDRIALARGTFCQGSFAPRGSGTEGHVIRLTAYGSGPRPKIAAPASARQALLLFNQEYWQIDSLDISGGSTYGVFVTGDKGRLHHIYLKNLFVHDVYGGAFKNKDNGLVVVGPGSINVFFDDILVDGVDAAHTNQWAGILVGGGSFPYKGDAPLNTNVQIRNSTVHDVYGDGIILFRDAHSSIRTSAAWQTGMQPTQDVGTPNAIWTWTCSHCVVADNEAYLTDSPGVDGGAYDIDWNNQDNTVERNYAHDTQGYCIAVFAAGYVTSNSLVRGNLCINNGLSPRLAALQGAVYISTWNDGKVQGLTFEGNEIHWNPPVPGAAAVEAPGDTGGTPVVFSRNTIESTSPLIYSIKSPWQSSDNKFILNGRPVFAIGGQKNLTLEALLAKHVDSSSKIVQATRSNHRDGLRLEAWIVPSSDQDGMFSDPVLSQLLVLRSVGGEYSPAQLRVIVHLPSGTSGDSEIYALYDFNDVYPGAIEFLRDAQPGDSSGLGSLRLLDADGHILQEWHEPQNAAAIGGALRKLLGPPDYSHMQRLEPYETQP